MVLRIGSVPKLLSLNLEFTVLPDSRMPGLPQLTLLVNDGLIKPNLRADFSTHDCGKFPDSSR